jgi:transposase
MAILPGHLQALLPEPSELRLEQVERTSNLILITVKAARRSAACPECHVPSGRIHSRYRRTLRDLPWHGSTVRLRLTSRRFYCGSAECSRKIFTERLPGVVRQHGRCTERFRETLALIGYALGGEAGARLAERIGVESSGDTILRILRPNTDDTVGAPVKVLGVDDWAWRKGRRYGTILVDLEQHRPIDLLPDRESETLKNWLEAHRGVEVISRDRAGAYAEGATKGAPEALQIADRFHILCNLTQALQRLLERMAGVLRRSQLSEMASEMSSSASMSTEGTEATAAMPTAGPARLNRQQRQSQERRERRKARYEAVRAAHQRGLSQRAIAREFGLTRKTVRRFLRSAEFPEQAPRGRRTVLEPYREYLEKRWAEGCHNAARLWRELREQGYAGQRSRVKEFLRPWRSHAPKSTRRNRKLPGPGLLAFWLAKPAEQRAKSEQQWVQTIIQMHPEIGAAEHLAQRFRAMVRNRNTEDLAEWLESAERSAIPELSGFAAGIRRDRAAVTAALEKCWSNGQVEGQIHRLKLLKRQMYGRAGFLLLRRRVLPFHFSVEAGTSRSP